MRSLIWEMGILVPDPNAISVSGLKYRKQHTSIGGLLCSFVFRAVTCMSPWSPELWKKTGFQIHWFYWCFYLACLDLSLLSRLAIMNAWLLCVAPACMVIGNLMV